MDTKISRSSTLSEKGDHLFVISKKASLNKLKLSKDEASYVKSKLGSGVLLVQINRFKHNLFVVYLDKTNSISQDLESMRKIGDELSAILGKEKCKKISIVDIDSNPEYTLSFVEGLVLANYKFVKYKKKSDPSLLKNIVVVSNVVSSSQIEQLKFVLDAVYCSRDLVNEPLSYLTAEQLGKEIKKFGKKFGFKTTVLGKSKIKALKMGGLLAVNKGSIDPPTFSIMEWKPKSPKNKTPIVFVGKGVVYDTGGLSLKPTPNSMDLMKCDMSGAASVIGAMCAIAAAKLPVHVVGLVPATDNRPSGNAYVPGDVIEMYDGTTVEVLNTDAEGRLILADALAYAKKYNPELVIDLATLTGAAAAAIGKYGIVAMHEGATAYIKQLETSGEKVYERLAEFPFWDEYGDLIKSKIADIKNLGGPAAGAITAGKFLHHFTDYPWIHLDIAGPAFLTERDSYRGVGGTGVGVRLLFDFISKQ